MFPVYDQCRNDYHECGLQILTVPATTVSPVLTDEVKEPLSLYHWLPENYQIYSYLIMSMCIIIAPYIIESSTELYALLFI